MLTADTERQSKDLLNETIGNLLALAETEAAEEHEQVLPCVPTVEVILLPTTWNGESRISVEQVSPLLCRAYLQSSSKVYACEVFMNASWLCIMFITDLNISPDMMTSVTSGFRATQSSSTICQICSAAQALIAKVVLLCCRSQTVMKTVTTGHHSHQSNGEELCRR